MHVHKRVVVDASIILDQPDAHAQFTLALRHWMAQAISVDEYFVVNTVEAESNQPSLVDPS